MMSLKKPLLILIVLSIATIVYEISLIRVFSVFMWYHFASLSIALAMLGLAGGGVIVCFVRTEIAPERLDDYVFRAALGMALSFLAVYLTLLLLDQGVVDAQNIFGIFQPLNYRPIRPVSNFGLSQTIQLGTIYLVISLPFWAIGTFLGLLVYLFSKRSPLIYGCNLLGSGLGCFLAVPLLNLISPVRLLLILGLICLLSVVIYFPGKRLALGAAGLLLVFFLALNVINGELTLDFTGGRFRMPLVKSAWNATSRVAVYRGGGAKGRWLREISERFTGKIPEQLDLVINYTGYTKITKYSGQKEELGFTRYLITALGYRLLEKPRTLILGAGGGPEILVALANDSPDITAVELNPKVVSFLRNDFAGFSGNIYNNPVVRVEITEGRNFLRSGTEKYDIIQASQLYSYIHPQAGAFQMSENYFYTVEAFRDYLDHLTAGGIISITHLLFPEARSRLLNLARTALTRQGVANPQEHIFMASQRGMTTLLVKKTAFNSEDLAVLAGVVTENGFKTEFSGQKPYQWPNRLKTGVSDFDLSPPTDDRPFFNYLIKPASFWSLSIQKNQLGYNDRTVLVMRTIFLITLILALVTLLLPAFLLSGPVPISHSLRPLTYFTLTGFAYMLIEIPLLKYLVFMLGQPIYSLSVTLFSLLVFGGLGSMSLSWDGGKDVYRKAKTALLLLSLGLPGYFWLLTWSGEQLIGYSLTVRIISSVLLVLPLGFLLGMPLAAGLSLLPEEDSLLPLGWAVNGLGSILGAIGGAIFTLNYGFTKTAYAGMLCYFIALLIFICRGKSGWSN